MNKLMEAIIPAWYRDSKSVFLKEIVKYPVWTCKDPVSLILRIRFSILGPENAFKKPNKLKKTVIN